MYFQSKTQIHTKLTSWVSYIYKFSEYRVQGKGLFNNYCRAKLIRRENSLDEITVKIRSQKLTEATKEDWRYEESGNYIAYTSLDRLKGFISYCVVDLHEWKKYWYNFRSFLSTQYAPYASEECLFRFSAFFVKIQRGNYFHLCYYFFIRDDSIITLGAMQKVRHSPRGLGVGQKDD